LGEAEGLQSNVSLNLVSPASSRQRTLHNVGHGVGVGHPVWVHGVLQDLPTAQLCVRPVLFLFLIPLPRDPPGGGSGRPSSFENRGSFAGSLAATQPIPQPPPPSGIPINFDVGRSTPPHLIPGGKRPLGHPKCPKPYKFIWFGGVHGPKPYKFIWFGDIHGPEPYKFIW
jgi:hypothetical protein